MTKHLCFGELIQIIHCSYTSEGLSHRSLMKPLNLFYSKTQNWCCSTHDREEEFWVQLNSGTLFGGCIVKHSSEEEPREHVGKVRPQVIGLTTHQSYLRKTNQFFHRNWRQVITGSGLNKPVGIKAKIFFPLKLLPLHFFILYFTLIELRSWLVIQFTAVKSS